MIEVVKDPHKAIKEVAGIETKEINIEDIVFNYSSGVLLCRLAAYAIDTAAPDIRCKHFFYGCSAGTLATI